MKTKIYINFVLIFLAVSFVSCDREEIIKDDTTLIFSFHRFTRPDWTPDSLSINANLTHYLNERHRFPRFRKTFRTNAEQWDYLKNAFDLETFKNIGEGKEPEEPIIRVGSSTFHVIIAGKTYSFTRRYWLDFENNENYQKMLPFMEKLRCIASEILGIRCCR